MSAVQSAARRQAAQTRRDSAPSIQMLAGPDASLRVPADAHVRETGKVRHLLAYDAGRPPPSLPATAAGRAARTFDLEAVCDLLIAGYVFPTVARRTRRMHGARRILSWLEGFDGETWEQRWLASGADEAPESWLQAAFDPLSDTERTAVRNGMGALLQARVLRPSYGWLLRSRKFLNLGAFLEAVGGSDLDRLRALPAYRAALPRQQVDAEAGLARMLIRTGKQISELTGDELLHYADIVKTSGRHRREHLVWELLVELGPLAGEALTLRAAWSAKGNSRQHSTATLVDRYGVPPGGVRDLLVDYLGELRPGMDYGSLEGLAYRLVRLFWREVLLLDPQQADLNLSTDLATRWRERLAVTTDGLPRRETHSILFSVRALYRDLAEWSHEQPERWARWVAPCPVPRSESRRAAVRKRHQKSQMHDRTRMLTPLLPALVDTAVRQRDRGRLMLERANATEHGEQFVIEGCRFVRDSPPTALATMRYTRCRTWAELAPGQVKPIWLTSPAARIDVTRVEDDGFWGWAVVETLRHTGLRREELLELTQLSLRHYTSPTTGTLVPLLHIVPSKTDCERLIPMSPQLVQVLLAVLRRAKGDAANVPMSVRYDSMEKTHGEPFPHLFARRLGTRQEVLSGNRLLVLLHQLAMAAGLTDAGRPVTFTPHDFRRLFATDAVNGGLPLHIAATLLGHLNLDTTRGYTAVFPEHVIAAHQAFTARRRQTRPTGEYRAADPDEWAEFENHFLLRRVALGDCHRPYGTSCVHEHACTRCRFLRVDPAQLGRIEDMTTNAQARLSEAREHAWLGEVAALEESLRHLRQRTEEARQRLPALGTPSPLNDF